MPICANMNELCDRIVGIVESLGYECVECKVRKSGQKGTVEVSIDSLGGITVGDCEKVSHAINDFIGENEEDIAALFPARYYLEVGSAGVERPIYTIDHFRRFAGRDVAIVLDEGDNANGTILSVDEAGVVRIETREKNRQMIDIAFERIKKAKLVYTEKKGEKKTNKNNKKQSGSR